MIDIETMGTSHNAAIVSIGAISFDLVSGHKGDEFYQRIDLSSCITAGLKVDAETIYWWFGQSIDAQAELIKTPLLPIQIALRRLSAFIAEHPVDVQLWANGSSFDLVILSNAYKATFLGKPWKYNQERDVRTLVSLLPEVKKEIAFKGLRHHALADCRHQIEYCSEIYHQLKLKH